MIAAFVAGLVALTMPCCFSVLLPSYFAQSFKQKSQRVGMTGLFSLGIATIMLPLAFGITSLGRLLGTNHELTFVAGGFLMIVIGFWTLWGRGMLPRVEFPVDLKKVNAVSVYTLGMFSGAATSCCAPVLAGILILTALTASIVEGLLIGFVYIFGMVFPLFVIAVAWEKYQARGENPFQGRVVSLTVFGREFSAHSTKLIAGVMFLVMGVVNILVGLTGTMIPAPGSAVVGLMQAQLQRNLLIGLSSISVRPEFLIALLIALLSMMILLICFRLRVHFQGNGNPKWAVRLYSPQVSMGG
jgi:cytochrome c biogenesis protein CcdA